MEKPGNRGFVTGSVAYVLYVLDYTGRSATSLYLPVNIFYFPKGVSYV